MNEYELELQDRRWKEKRSDILRRDNNTCRICGKQNLLEVHHRYYIYKALPWEYDNSALVTLCRDCHDLVHKTISPLLYRDLGNQFSVMNFTACSRCGGAGYIPEFRHVQNGICFRCYGKRYEELIDDINNERSELIDEDCYDVPKQDSGIAVENFEKGQDWHFGSKEKSVNKNNAVIYYRRASMNGHDIAQNNYGIILNEQGKYEKALRWLVYSVMSGYFDASSNVVKLLSERDRSLMEEWRNMINKSGIIRNMTDKEKCYYRINECLDAEVIVNHWNRIQFRLIYSDETVAYVPIDFNCNLKIGDHIDPEHLRIYISRDGTKYLTTRNLR